MTSVCDVAHIPHLVTKMTQVAVDNIKSDEWPCMAKMAFSADRWAAYIHANPAWYQ